VAEKDLAETRMMTELTELRRRVAELEQAEAESRRREEALCAITENIGDVIWELNRELQFTYVSSSVEKLVGYRPEEVVGKHLFSFLTPESVGIVAAAIRPLAENVQKGADSEQRTYDLDFVDKSGNIVPVEVAPGGRFDPKGELRYYQGVTRDITKRKRAEEALITSRLQLSEAMDLSCIVYWELDVATEELVLNDPFYTFYGTAASREGGYRMRPGEYAQRFVHPEDRPRFYRFADEGRASRGRDLLSDFEHRIIRRGGEVRHILARVRAIRDDAGNSIRVYGANQDITERKQAEQALRESEERFRKILQESRLGIVTVNADHRFASANPAFCTMLGYSEEELVSLTFDDLTHPEHVEQDRAGATSLFDGKVPLYRTEKRYIRKDGEIVWASASATTIRDESGDFLYFLTIVEDIMELKQAEEERAKLEDQLRQAQKMEAIGTLAGGVAHDFNNLLTVILGFANLIQMGTSDGDRVRPFADQIAVSANKAAELVRSLLAFSRKQHINLGPHKLNEVVKSTAKLLKRLLPEDIELKLDLSAEDPVAKLDITQIDQVLMNLATNGRDAMSGGGLFSIRTGTAELDRRFRKVHGFGSPGLYALLSVSDTGMGMDRYTMTRIFEPFFTTKGIGKGTGLGLASAYGIVKQHGGCITVRSERTKGTTFDIYLPLVDGAQRERAVPIRTVTGGIETILVVEDDQAVRNMIANVLGPQGYSVLEAGNGDEAMRVYREHRERVDLMLLDVVMPVRNGLEVLSEVLAIDPGMRAIFMSGYAGDIVLDKGVESETVDFIEKPLSIPKLMAKIREVLDR